MTDPSIPYTAQVETVEGWFYAVDVDLFSNLLAHQRTGDIRATCWRSAHIRANPPS